MNIESILISLILPVILLIQAFKLYRPSITGWFGEWRVRSILGRLNSNQFSCFHDVLLPINGETTQIDHIVLAGDRCFVIETKARDGWIFGSAYDKAWTQSLNEWSHFQFQNPMHQNYKHVLAVKNAVGSMPVIGVVVFTRGSLMGERIDSVLHLSELKQYLLEHTPLDSGSHDGSVQSLMGAMIMGKGAHKTHVRKLQKIYGGRWRVPVAHGMVVTAIGLFLFGLFPLQVYHEVRPQQQANSQYEADRHGSLDRQRRIELKEQQRRETALLEDRKNAAFSKWWKPPDQCSSAKGKWMLEQCSDLKSRKLAEFEELLSSGKITLPEPKM